MENHFYRIELPPLNVTVLITRMRNLRNGCYTMDEKTPYMPVFAVAYDNHCFRVYKKVSHLPSQLGIFVFTFTVKSFHIYGALLHLGLKVFTFTGPYYIFTFRGATYITNCARQPG